MLLRLPAAHKRDAQEADLGLFGDVPDKRQRTSEFSARDLNLFPGAAAVASGLSTVDDCVRCIKDLFIDFDKARVPQRRNLVTPVTTKLRKLDAPIAGAWKPVCKELVDFHKRRFEIQKRSREILLREEVSTERQGSNDVEFSNGWMRYLRLQHTLNSMGIIRSKRQRQIHEAFLMATVHHLWGDEWEACKVQVMRKLRITKRKEQVMAVAPRREGKSWVMMMYCLALALTIAGFKQALMAPSKRACKADMGILLDFLSKIPGGAGRIVNHSEEILVLSATAIANEEVQMARAMGGSRFKTKKLDVQMSGNNSTLQLFPSNERTSRGYTAKVTYMEEAAFMNASYFDKVILHQAVGVEGNSLLAISSPDDEYNYYSELVDLKDAHGEPLFHVIILGMACQDCINRGIAEKCIHKLDELAAWKSIERYMMVSQVLSRKKDIMMREQQGLMVGKRQPYFDPLYIRLLFERPLYNFANAPHILHMGMDPSGGGAQSNYTITTLAFENSMSVVSPIIHSFIRSFSYQNIRTSCTHYKVDNVDNTSGLRFVGRVP